MGFNILLVDDEELAIRGIEEGVNWDGLGIEKVFKAHSSSTAVRMISSYDIEIVLTDIEMPNHSGIELIQWVRENRPETMCIFYTGHAEFEYAQNAVHLGAFEYLLKPIPYVELEKVLYKGLEYIQRDKKVQTIETIWKEISFEESENVIEKVKQFIVEHLDEDLQRETLAAYVHMNSSYLARIFKKQENISLGDYIMEKRIAVAKQLLVKTNLQISIIANRIGVSYSSYFTKIFKDHEGISPQQYRDKRKSEGKDV